MLLREGEEKELNNLLFLNLSKKKNSNVQMFGLLIGCLTVAIIVLTRSLGIEHLASYSYVTGVQTQVRGGQGISSGPQRDRL